MHPHPKRPPTQETHTRDTRSPPSARVLPTPQARTFPRAATPSPAAAAVWAAVSEAAYAPKLSAAACTPRATMLGGTGGTTTPRTLGKAAQAAGGTPGGGSRVSRASNVGAAAGAGGTAGQAALGQLPGSYRAAAAASARFSSPQPSSRGGQLPGSYRADTGQLPGGGGGAAAAAHTTHRVSSPPSARSGGGGVATADADMHQQQQRGRPSLPSASAAVWPRASSPELLPLRRQSPSPRECDGLLEPRPDWSAPVLPYSEVGLTTDSPLTRS
jgi:hypothetical protein